MAAPKGGLYVASGAVAALVALAVAVFYFAMWPWMAPPPATTSAIEARWVQVRIWGASNPTCKKDPIAHSFIAGLDKSLGDYRKPLADKATFPRFDEAALSVEAQAALRGLDDWSKRGGGLVVPPSSMPYALPLYNLAKLALATATRLEDPAVSSVFHTATTLRRCGDFFGATVGFGISELLVRWLKDRGLRPDARFVELRPTRDELFAAVSRETLRWHDDNRHAMLIPASTPIYMVPFFDRERELAWLKYEGAERLFAANALGRDPPRMAKLYPDDENALPKSSLVRSTFMFSDVMIDKMGKSIERYDAALAAP